MGRHASISRRSLLAGLGTLPALTSLAELQARVGPPPAGRGDGPRELKPSGANLGSLFDQVEKLAGPPRYPLSFLAGRFRSFEEHKAQARRHLLDLLAYRPDKAAPKPEVIERVER